MDGSRRRLRPRRSAMSDILQPEQQVYLQSLLRPRDPLLAELEETAAQRRIPISKPEVGALLGVLAATARVGILEIGAAIGYGAIRLARGNPEVPVVTVERDPQLAEQATRNLARAGLDDRVEVRCGEAGEVLSELPAGGFDLVYLDCDKSQYRRLLDLSLGLVPVGGLVVADNVLWSGQVAGLDDPDRQVDAEAEALRTFNDYLVIHPQLGVSVLPLGDGLALAVKRRPLVTDSGGPF